MANNHNNNNNNNKTFYYTFHTGGVTQSALQQSEVIEQMSEQISSKQVQILHHKNQAIK